MHKKSDISEHPHAQPAASPVIAWMVESENGTVHLWPKDVMSTAPQYGRWVTPLKALGPVADHDPSDVLGWKIEFDDGSIEWWLAKDFDGNPSFGRWLTRLVAAGPVLDQNPDDPDD